MPNVESLRADFLRLAEQFEALSKKRCTSANQRAYSLECRKLGDKAGGLIVYANRERVLDELQHLKPFIAWMGGDTPHPVHPKRKRGGYDYEHLFGDVMEYVLPRHFPDRFRHSRIGDGIECMAQSRDASEEKEGIAAVHALGHYANEQSALAAADACRLLAEAVKSPPPAEPQPRQWPILAKLAAWALAHDVPTPKEREMEGFEYLAENSDLAQAWEKNTGLPFPRSHHEWFSLLGHCPELPAGLFVEGKLKPSQVLSYIHGKIEAAKRAGNAGAVDESYYSSTELADMYKVPPDNARKALDTWRKNNAAGDGYIEDTDRRQNAPRFVYRLRNVRHVMEGLEKRAAKRSIRRKKTSG